MMKLIYSLSAAALVLGSVLLTSCQKDGFGADGDGKTYSINGSVQKGPFTQGTAITINALDGNLNPTGQSYVTTTSNDFGSFSIGSEITSQYVEVVANGYYYNEVAGRLSSSPITLRSISDLSEIGQTNINILTTLEADRIRTCVAQGGMSFADARKKAEGEIYALFNIADTVADSGFDKADISKSGEANAILLAISATLQSNRSEAAMSELVAKIAAEIKAAGVVSSSLIKSQIRTGGMTLKADEIATNLKRRYAELELQNCVVPNFEDYLDIDGNGVIDKDGEWLLIDKSNFNVVKTGGTFTLQVKQNVEYEIAVDESCDWVTITKVENPTKAYLESDNYSIVVKANNEFGSRNATINVKELKSGSSKAITVSQQPATVYTNPLSVFNCNEDEHTMSIEINSSTPDFTVQITNGSDWIVKTDNTDTKYTFKISANDLFQTRSGQISILDSKGNVGKVLSVNQGANTATRIHVATPGTLLDLMNKDGQKDKTVKLIVTGQLNEVDFVALRSLPVLKYIDISGLSNTTLPPSTFKQMMSLETLILPTNLTDIPNEMCNDCSNLKYVFPLPANLKTIGESAFRICRKLTGNIKIPEGMTHLGASAFSGCQEITGDLVIPAGVVSLGGYGYVFDDCYKIGKMYCKAMTPPEALYNPWPNNNYLGVPIGTKEAYKAKWPNIMIIEEVDFDALGL